MAVLNLTVADVQHETDERAFEASGSLAAAGDSDVYLTPAGVNIINVTVAPAGGATGNVYTSTDKVATVQSGSGVTWSAWSSGAVAATTTGACYPVTAIKFTQTGAGTLGWSVRAQ